jgi:hypothetical protein
MNWLLVLGIPAIVGLAIAAAVIWRASGTPSHRKSVNIVLVVLLTAGSLIGLLRVGVGMVADRILERAPTEQVVEDVPDADELMDIVQQVLQIGVDLQGGHPGPNLCAEVDAVDEWIQVDEASGERVMMTSALDVQGHHVTNPAWVDGAGATIDCSGNGRPEIEVEIGQFTGTVPPLTLPGYTEEPPPGSKAPGTFTVVSESVGTWEGAGEESAQVVGKVRIWPLVTAGGEFTVRLEAHPGAPTPKRPLGFLWAQTADFGLQKRIPSYRWHLRREGVADDCCTAWQVGLDQGRSSHGPVRDGGLIDVAAEGEYLVIALAQPLEQDLPVLVAYVAD